MLGFSGAEDRLLRLILLEMPVHVDGRYTSLHL